MWEEKKICICKKKKTPEGYYREKCHRKSYIAISVFKFSERFLSNSKKNKVLCYNLNNE